MFCLVIVQQIYPSISAILSNRFLHCNHDTDAVGINIAGCDSQLHGRDVDTLIATRYQNNRLTVSTDIEETNTWIECFSIDIYLPTHYYFGFTATTTGQLNDNHDIIFVFRSEISRNQNCTKYDRELDFQIKMNCFIRSRSLIFLCQHAQQKLKTNEILYRRLS